MAGLWAGLLFAGCGESHHRGIDTQEQVRGVIAKVPIEGTADAQQLRQARQRFNKSHNRQSLHRKQAAQALGLHLRPANALYNQFVAMPVQGRQYARPEKIAGCLSGHLSFLEGRIVGTQLRPALRGRCILLRRRRASFSPPAVRVTPTVAPCRRPRAVIATATSAASCSLPGRPTPIEALVSTSRLQLSLASRRATRT